MLENSLHWCCLWESQKDKKTVREYTKFRVSSIGAVDWIPDSMHLYFPNYLQNCMAVRIFSPRDFFQVYFSNSLKINIVFKCHKPTFALSHIKTNTCDWKLYVHFGTWENIADILGMCYISCEIDMLFPFIFTSHGEINGEFSCFYMSLEWKILFGIYISLTLITGSFLKWNNKLL